MINHKPQQFVAGMFQVASNVIIDSSVCQLPHNTNTRGHKGEKAAPLLLSVSITTSCEP